MTKRGRAFSKGEKVLKGSVHSDKGSTHSHTHTFVLDLYLLDYLMFLWVLIHYAFGVLFLTLNFYSWFKV